MAHGAGKWIRLRPYKWGVGTQTRNYIIKADWQCAMIKLWVQKSTSNRGIKVIHCVRRTALRAALRTYLADSIYGVLFVDFDQVFILHVHRRVANHGSTLCLCAGQAPFVLPVVRVTVPRLLYPAMQWFWLIFVQLTVILTRSKRYCASWITHNPLCRPRRIYCQCN